MNVLITGATGFIGRHLVPALVAQGYSVTATVRDPALAFQHFPRAVHCSPDAERTASGAHGAFCAPTIDGIASPALTRHDASLHVVPQPSLAALAARGDSTEKGAAAREAWRRLVEGKSAVIHLAGIAHAGSAIADETVHAVNAVAPGVLATLACDAGAHVLHFSSVKAQTDAVSPEVITEQAVPKPAEVYGQAKLSGEEKIAASGGTFTIFRPVLVFGAGVKGNMAALRRIARLPVPLPLGGLTAQRSLLNVHNLCDAAHWALREREAAARNQTFVVADDDALTVPEMVTAMRAGMGRSGQLIPVPEAVLRRGANVAGWTDAFERIAGQLVVSTAKLRAAGWAPRSHVRDGLARFAASKN